MGPNGAGSLLVTQKPIKWLLLPSGRPYGVTHATARMCETSETTTGNGRLMAFIWKYDLAKNVGVMKLDARNSLWEVPTENRKKKNDKHSRRT